VNFCWVSPDGKLIAATGVEMTGTQLYGIDGGAARPISGLQPREGVAWTSDPRFLYVFQHGRQSTKVFRLDIVSGQRKFFREIPMPEGPGVCEMTHVLFSPDGRAYAYGYVRLLSDLYLVEGLR
jgi:Tol biopolymer transport system component